MGAVGEAYDEARLAIAENAEDIFGDVADFAIPGGVTRDSFGEDVAGAATTIEAVPCNVRALRAFERATETGVLAGADHEIECAFYHGGVFLNIPANATAVVRAHGLHPARTFRVTGPLHDTTDLKQRVAATLQH